MNGEEEGQRPWDGHSFVKFSALLEYWTILDRQNKNMEHFCEADWIWENQIVFSDQAQNEKDRF